MQETIDGIPIAGLEPHRLTLAEYHSCKVEHLELLDGYLCDGPPPSRRRRELLQLMLANVGLLEAVRLAPEQRWREALNRVYGSDRGTEG